MNIRVESYCKTIKGVPVLEDVSLSLESGRVYGLQGKNGSGKTMLLRALSGLIRPTSGYVAVDGEKLGKDRMFPRSIGLLIEQPAFIDKYTSRKNLKLLVDIQGRASLEDVDRALERVGLDPADKRHYRKYSLGMKQRLGIACAIMETPEVILLDEPLNALDPSGVELVEGILREEKVRGALIVLACHDAGELELLSDEIIVMASGRVVSSSVVEK